MGEILKVSQKTGEVGRPHEVKVLGSVSKEQEVKIYGAKTPGQPKIMDRTTDENSQPTDQ